MTISFGNLKENQDDKHCPLQKLKAEFSKRLKDSESASIDIHYPYPLITINSGTTVNPFSLKTCRIKVIVEIKRTSEPSLPFKGLKSQM